VTPAATVTLKRGGLYLSRSVYERYFAGLETIVLIRRERDLLLLPVRHAAAGGYLLKRRNGAGDRVVNAPDFFRAQGFDDETAREFVVAWDSKRAALVAADVF
jgi:hypothetical protein